MKWVRGKNEKREALSELTGATYVYGDNGSLRVARTKGSWLHLKTCGNLEEAQEAALEYDALLNIKCDVERKERVTGLAIADLQASVREYYRDVVLEGPLKEVYRAYCNLRKVSMTHNFLINQMENLSPIDRNLIGTAFEKFYGAGMRLTDAKK
jgi:hypothetical protein